MQRVMSRTYIVPSTIIPLEQNSEQTWCSIMWLIYKLDLPQSHARKILLILMISNLKLTTSVDSPRDCLGFLLCNFVFCFWGFFLVCLLFVCCFIFFNLVFVFCNYLVLVIYISTSIFVNARACPKSSNDTEYFYSTIWRIDHSTSIGWQCMSTNDLNISRVNIIWLHVESHQTEILN